MPPGVRTLVRKTWRTFVSIETGVVLLILVVILSAVGMIVLQRPTTRPEEFQRAYSPLALRVLDTLGLTDLFHAWWFLGLVLLVSLCIVAATIDRFQNRWRYFSRPYKFPEEAFRRTLPLQRSLLLADREGGAETGLLAAERALRAQGFAPERITRGKQFGIFAERHRIADLAVYIVHASLLLIFLGTLMNGLWGWHCTITLHQGQASDVVQLRNGGVHTLAFSIRCDGSGQATSHTGPAENAWSRLAVVDSGRELLKREILVDDSLNYGGVRFSQSSFASYDTVDRLVLTATPRASSGLARELGMAVDDAVALDPDWTVRLADISPTAAHADLKANDPAAHLVVTAKKTGKTLDLWLGQPGSTASIEPLPWQFQIKGLQVSHIMGLEASHEPGQWGVWAGVVLMAIGLSFAYFLAHERYWVVPIKDLRTGKVSLWIGGSANRTRIGFEARFRDVASEIEKEMKVVSAERATRYSLC